MKPSWIMMAAVLTTLCCTLDASSAPVIPGLSNKHPLTEAQVGQLLIGEMKCFACHKRQDNPPAFERNAPDLADAGSRIAPDYLQRFIESPSTTHSGTTMPDMLAAVPADQRGQIAEAITHFLLAQTTRKFEHRPSVPQDAVAGKALFHSIGCVACHSAREDSGKEISREGAIDLRHVKEKYSLGSLSEFLFQPTRVRPSGRMPDMKLSPAEAKAIASYLLGNTGQKTVAFKPQENLVALGKEQFQRLNCASCHKLGDSAPAATIVDLQKADLTRGCLSQTPGKAPRFLLDDRQTQAIRAALKAPNERSSDQAQLAMTLTVFNCIGCHARDNYGGVLEEINPLFTASEKELGDDGRIPPPLNKVGAKLLKVTMKKVLFDGDSVRTYMHTRMPQFGEANLHHLPDLFARLDSVKPVEFHLPKTEGGNAKDREREKELRAGGRELIGDKGLNCIACHSFNGKVPNKHGIDLLTTTQRLQPSWYYHFLQDPNTFRPRVIMPTSWPKGEAMHKTILNGDTDKQLQAIWYYLSLGTSAQEPSGMRPVDSLLTVTDATRTYRGRSSVAGYRGIAVGFPNQVNYAFNAETGTLSAIWKGEFIRVNRGGQGSGSFNPATRSILLAQDVSFCNLESEKSVWPLRPVMTKENPANPDPLYPKNLGYQFKGYYLDDSSIPTLMYRAGDIEVEDRSNPHSKAAQQAAQNKPGLERKLLLDSPREQTIWFRALTGNIEVESKTQFKTRELRLTIPVVQTVIRPIADGKQSELLLKIAVPKGQSSLTLTYEILP